MNEVNCNALFLYKQANHGISAITQPTSACSSCNVMLKALRAETVETTQCVYTASLTANSGQLLAFIHIYNKKKSAKILRKIPVVNEAYNALVICPSIYLFIHLFMLLSLRHLNRICTQNSKRCSTLF